MSSAMPPQGAPHLVGQQAPPAGGYRFEHFERSLADLRARASALSAAGDERAAFALTYVAFSERVRAALEANRFEDLAWATDLACRFVEVYEEQFTRWEARHPGLCRTWRVAFERAEDGRINTLQAVLLGINAHINYDLAFATLGACRHFGDLDDHDLAGRALGRSRAGVPVTRYRDYLVVNQLAWEAIDAVQDTTFRQLSPLLYRANQLTLRRSRHLGQRLLMESRDAAWHRTTLLVHAGSEQGRALVARLVDAQASSLADVVGLLTHRPDHALEHAVGWLGRGERLDPELQTGLVALACRNPVVAELVLRELASGGADPVAVGVTLLAEAQPRLAGVFGRLVFQLAPRRRRRRLARFLQRDSPEAVCLVEAIMAAGSSAGPVPAGVPVEDLRARWRESLAADLACLDLPEIRADPMLRDAVAGSAQRTRSALRRVGGLKAGEPAASDLPRADVTAHLMAHPDAWVRTCARATLTDETTTVHEDGEAMQSTIERVLFLKETSIFMEVDVPALVHVAERLEDRTYEAGERVVRQGEPTGGISLLRTGQVTVSQRRDGEAVTVATLGPRDCVGELSVLNGAPATAYCTASTPVTCWFLPSGVLSDLLHQHPRLSVGLLRVLSQRLVATTRQVPGGAAP